MLWRICELSLGIYGSEGEEERSSGFIGCLFIQKLWQISKKVHQQKKKGLFLNFTSVYYILCNFIYWVKSCKC